MGEQLKRPYEISVWEEKLAQNGSRLEEKKIAVIGSDTMVGLNKVYNPVFHRKSNGEKSLTFSLKYKYFDPYIGNEEIVNPFASLLTNERKIKLHYDNEWHEFVIKEHNESSEEYEWTYTCTDAFVLELSKVGYNITFNTDLNNNQGTAYELVRDTLKTTDWRPRTSFINKQLIAEPVYKGVLYSKTDLTIINANNDGTDIPAAGSDIYVFYSYVNNQDGKFVQFIIRDDERSYVIDDKNVITDTNFRITTKLVYAERTAIISGSSQNVKGFWLKSGSNYSLKILLGEVENRYQVNRLAYNQKTTYDPVMERTVSIFKAGDREIYKYDDNIYTTSSVVENLITNGDNFNVLESGSLQGWDSYVNGRGSGGNTPPLTLVTKPAIGTGIALADLSKISEIEGFLKADFKGANNPIYNSGFENNASSIGSISRGERFVFRWRARVGSVDTITTNQRLRLMVAKYTWSNSSTGVSYRNIDTNNIILDFYGTPQESPNIISGGYIENNSYFIDGVVQVPSTKYIYKNENDNKEYIWNSSNQTFVIKTASNYLPYYYLTAAATKSVSSNNLYNSTDKYGIFIEKTSSGAETYYIQDIQLTRYIPDGGSSNPVLIGNIPTTTTQLKEYYYLKPAKGAIKENIETYSTIDALKADLAITDTVKPLYNEDSEKVLSINTSQSNCFNILQTIAETFECWIDLVVEHDNNGYITYDSTNLPNKYVYIKEYAGNNNYAGFKYGINLQSIERNVNSDEIVTKLIVDQTQSDYVDEGYISIGNAPSNISGESYILNFNYYYTQGLLDREQVENDRLNFLNSVSKLNKQIKEAEEKRQKSSNALTKLNSDRIIYTELVETAKTKKNTAINTFFSQTGQSYNNYRSQHTTLDDDKQLTEVDDVVDTLNEIYVNTAVINNYSGVLSNINTEYESEYRKLYGYQSYNVKIWVDKDINQQRHVFVELSDFLSGFSFTIDGNTYTSSIDRKFFDIITNSVYISNIQGPSGTNGYVVKKNNVIINSYTINDNKTAKFFLENRKNTSVKGIVDIIDDLISEKTELIKSFENKYGHFIQEGSWSSSEYIDSELYYLDALQVSNTSAQPMVSYTINVVEISQLEGFEWYKFNVGDKTYVEDTEFFGWAAINTGTQSNPQYTLTPAQEEVVVSEIEWYLDEPDKNTITVQNYKTRFEDLFQRISATVQTVQYNEATYAKTSSLLNANGTINQNVLLNSLNNLGEREYNLTSNGSIRVQDDLILVQNLNNKANRIIINSEGLKVSSDGGNTWSTAIDGQGINAGLIYTGSLNTNEIIIGNKEAPSFRWDKSGISAFSETANNGYDLQTFVRFDQYGLYGIKDAGFFKARNLQEIEEKAHFGVTWSGFFIKNSYEDGGRVSITSDNDFQITKKVSNNEQEVIKIGMLERRSGDNLYGIRIKGNNDTNAFIADSNGNVSITGEINATSGNFTGSVYVGPNENDCIIINGESGSIYSSNNQVGAGYGWVINKDGDATFNNITARGAIKTAVFEYAEIQAVGGISIFRPSSVIKDADESNRNLVITVATPHLFKKGDWCKISNYINNTEEAPNPEDILNSNGLLHTYKIINIESNGTILTLENAKDIIDGPNAAITNVEELVGGALINMGTVIYKPTEDTEPVENKTYYEKDGQDNYNIVTNITSETDPAQEGYYEKDEEHTNSNNYGIGINSSDNVVNLPRRAISLFETDIDETKEPKVKYKYKTILGTLPTVAELNETNAYVNNDVYNNLATGQGIYTNNMYIGDNERYLAFYKNDTGSGMTIKTDSFNLESGNPANNNLIYLSDQPYGTAISVAGSPNTISDWTQVIGDNFGVTSNGTVYARGIRLTGSIYVGDSDLSNFVGIENGGIVLGQNNGFHIYIDGRDSGYSYDSNPVHTKTFGLGFYQGNHNAEYLQVYRYNFDPENNIYYQKAADGPVEGSAIPAYDEHGNIIKINAEDLDINHVGNYCVEKDKRIAYINDNKLSIPYTVVLKGMALGDDWIWELQSDTSNLTLKWNR